MKFQNTEEPFKRYVLRNNALSGLKITVTSAAGVSTQNHRHLCSWCFNPTRAYRWRTQFMGLDCSCYGNSGWCLLAFDELVYILDKKIHEN